ncbi:hypothetical protein, partial [Sphingomonas sp.]|uniref:hypothetical protein n=1 Tax=Sphingomonas sp. TaxID=28214 RepID=UPI00286D16EB
MMTHYPLLLLVTASTLALAACSPKPAETSVATNDVSANTAAPANPSDPVQSALSAAPEAIAREAAVMAPNPDGSMKSLREGKNGWTCVPDNPATPGPDPMCMDSNAM